MVSNVVWLQSALCSKSTIWVVLFNCYGYGVVWLLKCFLLKMNILCDSLQFLCFQVLFSSNVFPTQNQHFGWFPSRFIVSSVVWLQCVFHSKSTFWVGPFPLYGPLCCVVSIVVWLQYEFHSKSTFWVVPLLVLVPSAVWLLRAFCSKWTFYLVPFAFYGSQCCFAPMCFPLKINILGALTEALTFDNA